MCHPYDILETFVWLKYLDVAWWLSKVSLTRLQLNAQDSLRQQQVTGGKLREIQEEAKSFAVGNKALAALFVHTPAGELQRQIRSWLAENFEFLSVTGDEASGGTTGQLELLSTAIMDGWMAGLGAALPPNTDALGQLLSEYAKRVFTSQLQHLKVWQLPQGLVFSYLFGCNHTGLKVHGKRTLYRMWEKYKYNLQEEKETCPLCLFTPVWSLKLTEWTLDSKFSMLDLTSKCIHL